MKKPILLFLFLVSAAFADAQNFLIGDNALPSTLTACQTGNFETTIDLNGNNLTALDLSLEFQVSNLGLPVNSWTCSSCTPTATYPIALTNLSVLNADPVTPMLVSPGVYTIALSNITGTSVTLSYDYVIDCSIVPVDPNSMLTLSDSWTCLQGTLNGATSYDRNYNIDYPRFTVPGSQPSVFQSNYGEQLTLLYSYVYAGPCSTDVAIYFSNPDPVNCGAVDNLALEYSTDGVNFTSFLPETWQALQLCPGQTLSIRQTGTVNACLTPCNNLTAELQWRCAYAPAHQFCNSCPINRCAINYAINYNNHAPDIKLQRLAPLPLTSSFGNDNAQWDNSCPGQFLHWEYLMSNVSTAGIAKTVRVQLQFERDIANYLERQLSLIPASSISYTIQNCASCVVTLDQKDVYPGGSKLCSADVPDALSKWTLLVDNFEEGASIIFSFDTYRCCEEDSALYNQSKFYNQWYIRARGENECNGSSGNYDYATFPSNTPSLNHANTLFGFSGSPNGFSGGYISSHGEVAEGAGDLNLGLLFSPTVTDMSVMPGSGVGVPEEFFVQTLGMIAGNDLQLLGYNYQNSTQMNGILRARISCEPGLKVMDLLAEVKYHLLTDENVVWNPIACYSDMDPQNCTAGNFYLYYNLADPNAWQILQNGRFNFFLTPCCVGIPSMFPEYSVAFDLLPNNDLCYQSFNSTPNAPGTCTNEPVCQNCCWIPLSFRGNNINLHCPGCLAPGVIVSKYSLYRTSLGYKDQDNDRKADGATPAIIDPSYPLYDLVRKNYSSTGDLLEDRMTAFFQDGDGTSGGYTYAQMIQNNDGILDFLQLSRDIEHAETMDLQVTAFEFYIDDPVSSNPDPATCLECGEYGVDPGFNVTRIKLCVSGSDISNFMTFHSLGDGKRRYFFTFDLNDIASSQSLCGGTAPLGGAIPYQKYRLKVHYKACGNFNVSDLNTTDLDEVRKDSEILNWMWLSGTNQQWTVQNLGIAGNEGVNFQMPNTWQDVVDTGYGINGVPNYDDEFVNEFVFYCETYSGKHYFVSTNVTNGWWQPDFNISTTDRCNTYIRFDANTLIGSNVFNHFFPYEFKLPPISMDQVTLNVPANWQLTDVNYSTPFFSNQSVPQFLGISSGPGVVTINAAQLPPNSCVNSTVPSVSPSPSTHYFTDERFVQILRFFFSPIVQCTDSNNVILQPSDLQVHHAINPNNCLANVTTDCSYSITTPMLANSGGAYPVLRVQMPNLAMDFDFTEFAGDDNPACWPIDISNLDLTTGQTGVTGLFLAIPELPYVTDWTLNLNCGGPISGVAQSGYVYFDIGNLGLNVVCSGTLCANLGQCPVNDTIPVFLGYDCDSAAVFSDPFAACFIMSDSIWLHNPDVILVHEATPPNSYTLCEPFPVEISLSSDEGWVQPTLVSLQGIPTDLQITGCELYNCGNGAFAPVPLSPGTLPFTYDISAGNLIAVGFADGNLENGEEACIRVYFEGGCNYAGTLPTATIEGLKYCGDDFSTPVIDLGNPGTLAGTTCTDCFTCDSVSFTYETNVNCSLEVTAVIPANQACAYIITEWVYGDGSPNGSGSYSSHLYDSAGTYNVCMLTSCYAADSTLISSCSYCDSVFVACTTGNPCTNSTLSYELDNCSITLTAAAADTAGCEHIMYAWYYSDSTPVGPWTVENFNTHAFATAGEYLVCYTSICFDSSWSILRTCKVCEEVYVPCVGCEGFGLTAQANDDCSAALMVDIVDSVHCDSLVVRWYPGDGSAFNGDPGINYQYSAPGTYVPCYEAVCYDTASGTSIACKVCDTLVVDCAGCDSISLVVTSATSCKFEAQVEWSGSIACSQVVYDWSLEDGTILYNAGPSISHSFRSPGSYRVCVTIYCLSERGDTLLTCRHCEVVDVKPCAPDQCLVLDDGLTWTDHPGIGWDVTATSDGGRLIVGGFNEQATDQDLFIAKYDPNDQVEFSYLYGDINGQQFTETYRSVIERSDGYFAAGVVYDPSTRTSDLVVSMYQLMPIGTPDWTYRYDLGGDDVATTILDMGDAGRRLLVVGYTNAGQGASSDDYDAFALAIDPNGAVSAIKLYGNRSRGVSERAFDAIRLDNRQDFILAGEYENNGRKDMLMFSIDQNLSLMGSKVIAGPGQEWANSVAECSGYLWFAGTSDSWSGNSDGDVMMVRTDLSLGQDSTFLFGDPDFTEVATKIEASPAQRSRIRVTGVRSDKNGNEDGWVASYDLSNRPVMDSYAVTDYPYFNEGFNSLAELADGSVALIGQLNDNAGNEELFQSLISADGNSCCLLQSRVPEYVTRPVYGRSIQMLSPNHIKIESMKDFFSFYKESVLCSNDQTFREQASGNRSVQRLMIYPNPNTGSYALELTGSGAPIASIRILDPAGRLLQTIVPRQQDLRVLDTQVDAAISGICFVEVELSDGSHFLARMVVQR